MKKKHSFTQIAISILKWGLLLSLMLLVIWITAFIEEKKLILPVTEKSMAVKQDTAIHKGYLLSEIKTEAILEADATFLTRLFLSRPAFNLDLLSCLIIFFICLVVFLLIRKSEKEISFRNQSSKFLYWISAGCFIYCITAAIIKNLTNTFVSEFTEKKYYYNQSFESIIIVAFLGYLFFIIGNSFKKGFHLQQEQDLTV